MADPIGAARAVAPTARIGGKYALLQRLARGGMGDVWLARNETTQAHVALKILRPSVDQRTQAEERFRREARLGAMLSHRSIVRIFDLLEEPDGSLVLVMELLRGETLEQHIARRGPLGTREALAVVVAILAALRHGHDQGVVHRDVKPANVFLTVESDGHVLPKLLDYGIAKMPKSDSKTLDGLVLGTPSYMSPEQIRSEGELDGRSDLFATGVVFYEMLTGACPFQAPTPSAAIAAVLQNAVDPDPRIEPRLWIEVQRALAKRPRERHATAAEMSAALCAAAGVTEASVATALHGIARDGGPPASGIALAPPTMLETLSVEGQSLADVPGRRGASWVPWAIGGAVGGAILAVIAVIAMTATRPPVAGSPRIAGSVAVVPSANAGAGANAEANAGAGANAEANAEASARASANAPAAGASSAAPPAVRPRRPKGHARPIATSPGF